MTDHPPSSSASDAAPAPYPFPWALGQPGLIEAQSRYVDAFGKGAEIMSSTIFTVWTKQLDLLRTGAEQCVSEAEILVDVEHARDAAPKHMAAARTAVEHSLADLREINDATRNGIVQLFGILTESFQQSLTPPGAPAVESPKPQKRSAPAT